MVSALCAALCLAAAAAAWPAAPTVEAAVHKAARRPACRAPTGRGSCLSPWPQWCRTFASKPAARPAAESKAMFSISWRGRNMGAIWALAVQPHMQVRRRGGGGGLACTDVFPWPWPPRCPSNLGPLWGWVGAQSPCCRGRRAGRPACAQAARGMCACAPPSPGLPASTNARWLRMPARTGRWASSQ